MIGFGWVVSILEKPGTDYQYRFHWTITTDLVHKSHSSPVPCPTMDHSEHISVLNNELWDMEGVHYGFVSLVLYRFSRVAGMNINNQ